MAVSKNSQLYATISLVEWMAEKTAKQQACAQIKVLEQALKFLQDIERQLRGRIALLEKKLQFDSAHYPEGFRWDIDDYPAQQTRRWNPETRELEPGQDPPFVAPPAVPFEETDNAA